MYEIIKKIETVEGMKDGQLINIIKEEISEDINPVRSNSETGNIRLILLVPIYAGQEGGSLGDYEEHYFKTI